MNEKTSLRTPYILLGLSLLALGLGQLLLAFGRNFVASLTPIDWAHWLLLVGAGGMLASFFVMPLGAMGKVARIFVLVGALGFAGMTALDLFLDVIARSPVVNAALHDALASPAVAIPFLWVGPSLLFVGLAVKTLEWWRHNRWAAALIFIGAIMNGAGQSGRIKPVILLSFVVMLVGVGGLLAAKKRT